ncbi:MAG: arylsulfatase [Opitutaceae bacterium]
MTNLNLCKSALRSAVFLGLGLFTFSSIRATEKSLETSRPNIVFILADDMGYGDVQVLNPERGKIKTPHMDRLAAEGMVFTDAHTSSSVCTPTRYGLLTGRYNWRSSLQSGVTWGYSSPIIPTGRMTVAGMLRQEGYKTALFGKWHLGLHIPTVDGKETPRRGLSNVDWKGRITGGPVDLGFDTFFGISASLDMTPYIYIQDDRFVGEGTVEKEFHPGRDGAAAPDFEAIDVLVDVGEKSVEYILQQDASQPFFTYIPLASPHTPILPTPAWQGKSGLGPYADFMMQTDAVIGQILQALEDADLADNTLVIVSSDNGCSPQAKFDDLNAQGHFPSAQFRGSKADLWDGGHRVPFIVRWPGQVKPGALNDALICLTDFMATSAEIVGAELPGNVGEDSVSFLPALKGQKIVTERKGIIHHSISGHFAYRESKWKLLLAKSSGGWTAPREQAMSETDPKAQLYDMEADPGETTNLYEKHPKVASRLLAQLTAYVENGRSTDGPPARNDVATIKIWK